MTTANAKHDFMLMINFPFFIFLNILDSVTIRKTVSKQCELQATKKLLPVRWDEQNGSSPNVHVYINFNTHTHTEK